MTSVEIASPNRSTRDLNLLCVAVFSATSFLSAVLLFCIEPLFSKMVLPVLGGSAAVWSVAMVVFQSLLLAGYVYAWALSSFLGHRKALLLHLLLLLAASLFLPIAIAHQFSNPPQSGISFWLIALFLSSIGFPFFAVAANAPLLQAWFARTTGSENPYFLYRASNLGSFAVLLAYPVTIEPAWGLQAQSHIWSLGYGILALGIAACGILSLTSKPRALEASSSLPDSLPTLCWRDRLTWMALGLVPSGLLVAVTAHIATDIASAPFLWIAPLALYLLTFVLTFSERPAISMKWLLVAQPITIASIVFLLLWGPALSWSVSLLAHLAAFFVAAMICHTMLFRRRPDPARLTEFYVWMSLGGVLGGIFAALVAPAIFNTVLEYPILLVAAFAMRPDLRGLAAKMWLSSIRRVLAASAALVVIYIAVKLYNPVWAWKFYALAIIAAAVILAISIRRPVFALSLAAVLFALTCAFPPGQNIIYRGRSFFGVYKVLSENNGDYHLLVHGTTTHGVEQMRDASGASPAGTPAPLSYYYRGGALGNAVEAARGVRVFRRVAAVGLGIGALSCYRHANEHWTFYELDPLVERIARNTALFRSRSACASNSPVVLGDARLTLKDVPRGVDLLILDAFTSDSVPVHLLTREAFALYKSKLSPHGIIVFHISNRNLELSDVVSASAQANGMFVALHKAHFASPPHTVAPEVAVVAQNRSDLAALKLDANWKSLQAPQGFRTWTDDYSNILGVLLQRLGS